MLDDTHLGACLAEHGGIPQAWADFQAERAAAARQKELDRLHEIYGHNHFKDDDHDDDPLGDAQGQPPAVWGGGSDVLWSAGETLIIEADIGLGKTSLAGLLVRALLFAGEVLGQPVKQLAPGQKVLYLALDRPDQCGGRWPGSSRPSSGPRSRAASWSGTSRCPPTPPRIRTCCETSPNSTGRLWSSWTRSRSSPGPLRRAGGLRVNKAASSSRHGRGLVELHHLTKGPAPYGSVFIPAGGRVDLRFPAVLAEPPELSPTGSPRRISSGHSK